MVTQTVSTTACQYCLLDLTTSEIRTLDSLLRTWMKEACLYDHCLTRCCTQCVLCALHPVCAALTMCCSHYVLHLLCAALTMCPVLAFQDSNGFVPSMLLCLASVQFMRNTAIFNTASINHDTDAERARVVHSLVNLVVLLYQPRAGDDRNDAGNWLLYHLALTVHCAFCSLLTSDSCYSLLLLSL